MVKINYKNGQIALCKDTPYFWNDNVFKRRYFFL